MRLASLRACGFAVFALLPLGTQAAAQGLAVAAPQEIVAGARSCASAISAAGVDEHKLVGDGWHHAAMSVNGKAIDALSFYGKGKLLLTLTKGPGNVCVILARIARTATFAEVRAEMDRGLGTAGETRPGEANAIYWFAPPAIVQMATTGKPEAPSVRVAVGYYPAEKK